MRVKSLLVLLLLGFFTAGNLSAQEEPREETLAHSTGVRWKGFDVDSVVGNSAYAENGKRFYLYNVGTGRFVIDGGNWGMEGRLFHDDFGRPLYLKSDGYTYSLITEQYTAAKDVFGCNVPQVSKKSATWNDYKKFSFTSMMDVNKNDLAPWTFQRVEDPSDTTTYTYYMWEEMSGKNIPLKKYYLGAAYCEWHAPDKGDGEFIHLDDDRSGWTTAEVIGNMSEKEVRGDLVTVDELYQWRLISEEEFIRVLNEEIISVNPSVSSLIPDRDFSRNADKFVTWVLEEAEGAEYSQDKRYGYTNGEVSKDKRQQDKYNDEAWDSPVRLKGQFGDPKVDPEGGMKNSKFGFLSFEGVGRTYTSFVVPKAGWYEVQCYGFVHSTSNHNAYLFAKVAGSTSTSSYGGESKINLPKDQFDTFETYPDKKVYEDCLAVGKELTYNGSKYLNTVWICVTNEQFESGDSLLRTIQVGVGKDEATQSEAFPRGNTNYYYDTDWVCVDDFRATYMGEGPVFFYEDETTLDYLNVNDVYVDPPTQHNQTISLGGRYSGAACLERSFKKGMWNSFSFPLPLTGEQVRNAFGDDAQLARIHSVGNLSKSADVIDFKSVSLRTTDNVVEPGQFYLLKPTADPIHSIDPKGREADFYDLGRMFFSVNENETEDYKFPKMKLSNLGTNSQEIEPQEIESFNGENDGTASVNYVKTVDYNNFIINSDGLYIGGEEPNIYAPNGSYVVSKGTIYHINKDTPLKGFRGWINLTRPIAQNTTASTGEAKMSLYGMFYKDDEPTDIDTLPESRQQASDGFVYDLSGRKLGRAGMDLPKGLYIVNGKKYLVK